MDDVAALHGTPRAGTLHSNVGTETESAITDMRARVAAMRELGVVKWADIELGPKPGEPGTSQSDEIQRAEAEAAKKEREQRIRFGASGGPRRLADNR